jgi:hypothetical protein
MFCRVSNVAPAFSPMTLEPGERVAANGVVESVQRTKLPEPIVSFDEVGARRLGVWYWASVRRATRGAVRTHVAPDGVAVTLLGIVSLLRFGPAEPHVSDSCVTCAYPIEGGVLAVGAGGWLEIEQRGATDSVLSIVVRGYHARLALRVPWIYRHIQAPLHLVVSRVFLQQPARRFAR